MSRILVVEDDKILSEGLRQALDQAGYEVYFAMDGAAGLRMAREKRPDLLILDIMMPKLNGFELITELRRQGDNVSVIVLSARTDAEDKVRGLDLGADDYLGKPFERAEFEARVRALLRRGRGTAAEIGALKWSWESHQGWIDGQPLTLTRNETIVLEAMLHAGGRIVSKASLAQRAAADDEPTSDNSIEVYVYRLRRKLEPAGLRIKTVRGLGYSLQAEA